MVVIGDPADIGPEITIRSPNEAGLADTPVVVVGCVHTLRRIAAMNIASQAGLRVIQKVCDAYSVPGVINVVDEPLANPNVLTPGAVQAAAGDLAYCCTRHAAALALSDEVKAIATTSLSKEALYLGGHGYPGHMELLARPTGSKEYAMVLCADKLKVTHILTHISLCKFLDTLSGKRVKAIIRVANHFLKRVGIERPRIAVAGISPHAGEHGLFGIEEIEIVAPTIEAIQAEDIDVTGPCLPDTVFMQCHEGLFDMVMTMYHDRGRIPLKLLGFYDRVNIIAGLPLIRTSADHGTTFDIVWTGKIKSKSMAVSIQLTIQIS